MEARRYTEASSDAETLPKVLLCCLLLLVGAAQVIRASPDEARLHMRRKAHLVGIEIIIADDHHFIFNVPFDALLLHHRCQLRRCRLLPATHQPWKHILRQRQTREMAAVDPAPLIGAEPGKEEIFRCRWGMAYL